MRSLGLSEAIPTRHRCVLVKETGRNQTKKPCDFKGRTGSGVSLVSGPKTFWVLGLLGLKEAGRT